MTVTELIDIAIRAALLAGVQINHIYSSADLHVQLKKDNSPLTLADTRAHEEIMKGLKITCLPVLSEEGAHLSYAERKDWDLFWMVDPLDGTKEFIKRNDEFTVNIALIQKNRPVAGVIYAPATGELFVGISGAGAWKIANPSADCTVQMMQDSGIKLPQKRKSPEYVVAASRSHMNQETEAFIQELRKKHESVRLVSRGSSLKICMVAEGIADVYPRFGPTMEWDTAAGHAIAKAAGKNVFLPDLQTELSYNKENLQNPHFKVI